MGRCDSAVGGEVASPRVQGAEGRCTGFNALVIFFKSQKVVISVIIIA